eukprot:XP_028343978.1 uncharacterized protein LOC114486058 [Physeter catodon]
MVDEEDRLGAKSDLVRLLLLHSYGGVYADVDMELIREFPSCFLTDATFFAGAQREDAVELGNALLGCTPRHELLTYVITQIVEHRASADEDDSVQAFRIVECYTGGSSLLWQEKHASPLVRSNREAMEVIRSTAKVCKSKAIKQVKKDCPAVDKVTTCQVVSDIAEDICLESSVVEEEYSCWNTEVRQECETQMMTAENECTREVQYPVPYEVVEVEFDSVCKKVEKPVTVAAVREKIELEEYSCPEVVHEKECHPTTKQIQKPCLQKQKRVENYDCSETKMQHVEKTCTKMVPRESVVTTCTPTLAKKLRRLASVKHVEDLCTQKKVIVEEAQSYPCEDDIPIIVPKICQREVEVDVESSCTETVPDQVCHMVQKTLPKTCTRPRKGAETYEYQDVTYEEICEQVPREVKKTALKMETKTEKYPCETANFREKCVDVTIPVQSVCKASIMKTVEKKCPRTVYRSECKTTQVEVTKPCYAEVEQDEEYTCYEHGFKEKCSTLPVYHMGKCKAVVSREEEVPCTRPHVVLDCAMQAFPVKKTCFKEVADLKDEVCYTTASQPECVDLIITALGGERQASTRE